MNFDLLYFGVIVWVTARLFIYERGLWGVFAKLRGKFGITEDAFGNPLAGTSELSKILSCLVCLSVWLAIIVTVWQRQPWHTVLWYTGFSVFLNRISA